MVKIEELVNGLKLKVICGSAETGKPIRGAYASDLLSDVMGKAREGEIWITLQTHKNIIAVASLKELAAILIVNGGVPDSDTVASAESEGIVLLGTEERTFQICGKLYKILERDALV
jgi:hypothetical protein